MLSDRFQRTGKSSACNVVKVADNSSTRPSGLFIRNKLNSIDETVPRMIAIRQPKGPEGKGFSNACRAIRLPGKNFLAQRLIDFTFTNNSFFVSHCRCLGGIKNTNYQNQKISYTL